MARKAPQPTVIPSEAAVMAEKRRLEYRKKYRSVLTSTTYILIVVAAVSVLLATLFLPVLQVSGTSMEPTLSDGDIILLLKGGDFETGELCGFYYQNRLLLKPYQINISKNTMCGGKYFVRCSCLQSW